MAPSGTFWFRKLESEWVKQRNWAHTHTSQSHIDVTIPPHWFHNPTLIAQSHIDSTTIPHWLHHNPTLTPQSHIDSTTIPHWLHNPTLTPQSHIDTTIPHWFHNPTLIPQSQIGLKPPGLHAIYSHSFYVTLTTEIQHAYTTCILPLPNICQNAFPMPLSDWERLKKGDTNLFLAVMISSLRESAASWTNKIHHSTASSGIEIWKNFYLSAGQVTISDWHVC